MTAQEELAKIMAWARGKCSACLNQHPHRRDACQECRMFRNKPNWIGAWECTPRNVIHGR